MTDTPDIADRTRSSELGRRGPDKKPSPAVSGVGPHAVASFETVVETARALAAPGKGILAADESTPTMAKRLAAIRLESTEQRRRAYREILFGTPGLGECVSGVILFDETIRQRDSAGAPFVEVLERQGVIPGSRSTGARRPSRVSRTRW